MKVILKEGFTYIPKWNDNDKEKPEDQIIVEFQFMTGLEAMDLFKIVGDKAERDSLLEWELICKSVTNLKDGNGKDIHKMKIPQHRGLAGLYSECLTAFRLESEVDKKK